MSKYPDETAVFTKYFLDIDISIDGNNLLVKSHRTEEKLLLNDQTSMHARDQIYSSSFEETSDIEAYTLIPHKNKYKKQEVVEFKETYDKNSSVFFDDTKVLNFIYPALTKNAKTYLSYIQTHKEPRFIPSYFLQTYIPIIEGRFTITADKGVSLIFKPRNLEGVTIDSSVSELKGRIKYSFKVNHMDKISFEESSPNLKYFAPHINILVQSYETTKRNVPLLKDEHSLYSWYKSFVDGLRQNEDEELRNIVNQITEGKASNTSKVKAIYYWVQKNIKYVAFEDGMRGFIPHNGGYVCEKRFGDCKDMASILINMMHMANIRGYFTWVGTRDIPYNYSDTPSPIVDNHMIATYIDEQNNYYYLDATSQYSPFGLPSSMIQGKEVLIGKDDGPEIRKVPIIEKENNIMLDSISLTLADGVVEGSGKVTLTGYAKVFNTYRLITKDSKSEREYLLMLLAKGSNKFNLKEYKLTHVENLDTPIDINYTFDISDYYNTIGNEIYINPNLDKSFIDDLIDQDRKYPKENEYRYINRIVTKLNIPDNHDVSFLPKNTSFSNEIFGYHIKYSRDDVCVYIEKEFYLDYLLLEKHQFSKWNEAIKELSEALRESIIFKKNEL